MRLQKEISDMRLSFEPLTLYQKFEHICVMVLTALIAIIIVLALWNLTLKILLSIVATNFDPTDYVVFQAVFGTIFTDIIALEFKRSGAQTDHPRSVEYRCFSPAGACRSHPCARRGLLAGPRAGAPTRCPGHTVAGAIRVDEVIE
jgi:hypothetical protein